MTALIYEEKKEDEKGSSKHDPTKVDFLVYKGDERGLLLIRLSIILVWMRVRRDWCTFRPRLISAKARLSVSTASSWTSTLSFTLIFLHYPLIFYRFPSFTLHTYLKDAHLYLFAKWTLELLEARKSMLQSISHHFVPYLLTLQRRKKLPNGPFWPHRS